MDYEEICRLAKLMQETGLTRLKLRQEQDILCLERTPSPLSPTHGGEQISPPSSQPAPPVREADVFTVISPLVGVFYAAPAPDAPPFVSVGDRVRAGDVLCIIEAMKMMNEIPAEKDGVIVEICAGNGQVVEYGHPLFRLKPVAPEGEERKAGNG